MIHLNCGKNLLKVLMKVLDLFPQGKSQMLLFVIGKY